MIAAAGDIACDPDDPDYNGGAGRATTAASEPPPICSSGAPLAAVLPLGDIQYDSASLSNINAVYHPTWGRVKSISRPILGNHERQRDRLLRLLQRPGRPDGPPARAAGLLQLRRRRLAPGRAQLELLGVSLRGRLGAGAVAARRPRRASRRAARSPTGTTRASAPGTTAATPPCSRSGRRSTTPAPRSCCRPQPQLRALRAAERERRRRPGGGIREFVVGTGGAFFTGGLATPHPQQRGRQNNTFGVLKLTLHPYELRLAVRPEAGKTSPIPGPICASRQLRPAPGRPRARPLPVISKLRLSPKRFGAEHACGTSFRRRPGSGSRSGARLVGGYRVVGRIHPVGVRRGQTVGGSEAGSASGG